VQKDAEEHVKEQKDAEEREMEEG
jgi:hypothetical protein